MQILPQQIARAKTSAADLGSSFSSAEMATRQSALFARMLDSARSSSAPAASDQSASFPATAASVADPVEAAAAPSERELRELPVSKEDLAALREDLKSNGFSEEELAALDERAGGESGLTWGEVMSEVKKKVATTEQPAKKEISNDDKVQLLGLFGKLGFTAAESQNLVDSLAKGETEAVWTAINGKVDGFSKDGSISLGSSELAALGRNMNLSAQAQSRLTTLLDQSNAEQGLSAQGVATAMNLVKNELLAQIGQENQALSEFRQAASKVMAQAWQRETGKKNSDMHQDDVARKAAQVVAMGAGKGESPSGVPTASKPGVDVLADVPRVAPAGADAANGSSQAASQAETATLQNMAGGRQAVAAQANAAAELTGRAAPVATEQAAATSQLGNAASGHKGQTAETALNLGEKPVVAAAVHGGGGNNAGAGVGGHQGGAFGGFFEQHSGQDAGWGEFWSKVRSEKTAGVASAPGSGASTAAAMDAVKTSLTGPSARTADPNLGARVARQLETGILRNVGQDAKQLTLRLSPEELGKLNVTLTVKDKEVRAVIVADNADTAAMLQEQAAQIKQNLENQGFKVTKLDVQTGLAQDNQMAWQSPEQHNQAREQREALERIRSSVRLARQAVGADIQDAAAMSESVTARAAGLDLFA